MPSMIIAIRMDFEPQVLDVFSLNARKSTGSV